MKIKLVRTCSACPEQYDAYHKDKRVAYLRLRHGHFTVRCPYVGDELVYSADTIGDGWFYDSEREHHLKKAKKAIKRYYAR